MKTHSKIATIGAAAALMVTLAACSPDGGDAPAEPDTPSAEEPEGGEGPSGDPIIIGLDEDSTGPGAVYMTIAGETVRMAVEEINDNGGILGRPVELIVGNDESDPTKTPSVLRKLIDDGADVLFIATGGGSALQAKPVVQEAGVVSIAPVTITSSVGLPPDNEYMFLLANSLDDFTEVYCGAFEKMGWQTLGLISDNTPAIEAIAELLNPGLEGCVDIVADEKAPLDAADLSAQAARVKAADPDVILVMSVGGNFEVLAHNTLAPLLPDVKRFSLASLGNQPDTWTLAQPGVLQDVIFMGSLDMDNPRTQELEAKLKERHGDDYMITAYDPQAYDGVYLLKEAIEAAGGTEDAEAILEAMESLTGFQTSFGQAGLTASFTADDHIGADSACGLVLSTFDENNELAGAWSEFQVACD